MVANLQKPSRTASHVAKLAVYRRPRAGLRRATKRRGASGMV